MYMSLFGTPMGERVVAVLEEVGFDGDYVQVMIRRGEEVFVTPVTLSEFMNGQDVTDWLMLTRVQVVTSFRDYFAKEGNQMVG